MTTEHPQLAIPPIDGRTREAQVARSMRAELERRLGPDPSLEARLVAEQLIRVQLNIAVLERQRRELGPLGTSTDQLLLKREDMLMDLLERLERVAPAASQTPPDNREPELATA